jgi:SAM-dependent methyltransferase
MQSYGQLFARVYNLKWQDYANRIAPLILAFYESTETSQQEKSVLDLCCGTGQLSVYFLEHGYRVVGLDLSEGMLQVARENALPYIVAQQVRFIQGDAADFKIDQIFGLIVSTFDALNHLPNLDALQGCFRSTYQVMVTGGYFIFDLNTRHGLDNWNSISVDPGNETFLINRGIFDPDTDKAWTRITGFVRNPDGLYQRFEQTVYNTVFDLQQVKECLMDEGYRNCYYAHGTALDTPVEKPEELEKVFMVAQKI